MYLNLSMNKLEGPLPLELFDIEALIQMNCNNNHISGPSKFSGPQERERVRQLILGHPDDGLKHSWALRIVESLVSFWHFCLPVLDDATDLWLLVETSGGNHSGLWWTCLIVLIVADIERVYTGFFFIVLNVSLVLELIARCCCGWVDVCCGITSLLAFGQEVGLDGVQWLWLDSLLWTLFGSRARSSPFMGLFGMAGQSRGADISSTGFGFHGIDVFVFYHPFRYLGEFIMSFPRGNRRNDITSPDEARRRDISMVRAVGETLCVDPLFLALSVVTGGWDENVTGFALLSALFSMLELVTELQYYVSQAEAGNPATQAVGTAEDTEGGNRIYGNPGPRPVESSVPIRF
ncbi:unnamed protein product [Ascophyllum nodosum]